MNAKSKKNWTQISAWLGVDSKQHYPRGCISCWKT
ncbi:MAG: hypothetical protein JWN24_1223 [Phycisphaerales bacterium]|nr:hypothetical protein [Phycisphaerales bacterium]